MSLIRGVRGKLPCPVCRVPEGELADISRTWPLRTAAHSQQVINGARTLNKKDCESLLSAHGLRCVDVSFLKYVVDYPDIFDFRTSFGSSRIQTRIERYLSTGYIRTTVGYSGTTCGRGSRCYSLTIKGGATTQPRLTSSNNIYIVSQSHELIQFISQV